MQRLEKSLAAGLRSYMPHQAITPTGVFYSVRTSHIPHLYITLDSCTMLCTLPVRLFCIYEVSAAAFSLFRCLPVDLQAVTHGFLFCVWLTFFVTGVPTGRQQ